MVHFKIEIAKMWRKTTEQKCMDRKGRDTDGKDRTIPGL